MFGIREFEIKYRGRKIEKKKKKENRFKVNKLLSYFISNLFNLFYYLKCINF